MKGSVAAILTPRSTTSATRQSYRETAEGAGASRFFSLTAEDVTLGRSAAPETERGYLLASEELDCEREPRILNLSDRGSGRRTFRGKGSLGVLDEGP